MIPVQQSEAWEIGWEDARLGRKRRYCLFKTSQLQEAWRKGFDDYKAGNYSAFENPETAVKNPFE